MARIERVTTGWRCHAAEILTSREETLACSFAVTLDPRWVTQTVQVAAVSRSGERHLVLRADTERRWCDDHSEPVLQDCVDVDVAATPLTNTFPIRRLAWLPTGDERTSPVAWVEVPSLRVMLVEQTYRRLEQNRWRYRDPAHGPFELVVDNAGFVLDYEGFAQRIGQ